MDIAKFLRTAFLCTSRSSCLQLLFEIGVFKSFPSCTRKHLCWSLFFLKKLAGSKPAIFFKKKVATQVFSCEVYEIFKNTFFYRTPLVTVSAPVVAASVFFLKKVIKQLFPNLVMTYK